MPIYEYVCQQCGNVLELLQKVGQDQPEANCPVCSSRNFTKKISAANISRGTQSSSTKETTCCGNEKSSACPPGGCCGGRGNHI